MPAPLERVQDGDWDALRRVNDTAARLLDPVVPQARVYNSANISISNNTVTALTFNSERFDNGDLHSTSSNTDRLTAPVTGLYAFGATVQFASNATGRRQVTLTVNGTEVAADERVPVNGAVTIISVSSAWQLTAGDIVRVAVFQTSGGALNVQAGSNYTPEFWMYRVAGFVNQGV